MPYLVVIAIGAFLYNTADNFAFQTVPGRIGPGAWPKLILILMMASAFYGFVASALHAQEPSAKDGRRDEASEVEALLRPPELYPRFVWLAIGATFAYLLLLSHIGFFLDTIIYTGALLYLGHYRHLALGLTLSVILSAVFMLIFMRAVYVALPPGAPPFDHVSYAVMAAMGVR